MKRVSKYLNYDIWYLKTSQLPIHKAVRINIIRALVIAVKGFIKDQCQLKASALTFYTLLSIVPIVAMLIALARGFGMEAILQSRLQEEFEHQQEVLSYILSFAQSFLENMRTGTIAGVGIVILLYTIIMVMGNIESSFNEIWGISKSRTIGRKLSDYLFFIFIATVLLILSGSVTVFLTTFLKDLSYRFTSGVYLIISFFLSLKILAYVIPWILFTFIYLFMPNTKVKIKSGLVAGIIAGSIYQIIQWSYINFQIQMTAYNAVYGSFAALPLFLIWLQLSWLTVLFGAELCFAHENVENREYEPDFFSTSELVAKKITVMIASAIYSRFNSKQSLFSELELSLALNLPVIVVRKYISILRNSGIILEVKNDNDDFGKYIPALPLDKLSIPELIQKIETAGKNEILCLNDSANFAKITAILDKYNDSIINIGKNDKVADIFS